uniref:C2 domain-containing protein n=1 Tax=Trichuris muris TaxID=70415 RepID=A0A5S6QB21_TRIMR
MDSSDGLSAIERSLYGDVEGDAELEAELRSLQLGTTTNADDVADARGSSVGGPILTAALAPPKEVDDEFDDSLDNDEQLISELASLMDGKEVPAANISCSDSGERVSLSEIEERIGNYNEAAKEAEASENFGKLRRMKRGLAELEKIYQVIQTNPDARFDFVPPKIAANSKVEAASDADLKGADLETFIERSSAEEPHTISDSVRSIATFEEKPVACMAKQTLALSTDADVAASVVVSLKEGAVDPCGSTITTMQNSVAAVKKEQCNEAEKMDCPENIVQLKAEVEPKDRSKSGQETAVKVQVVETVDDADATRGCATNMSSEGHGKAANNATSIAKELEARMAVYVSAAEAARGASNSSKVRRMERIVKQYKSVIAAVNGGKPYKLSELPVPPGFEPFMSDAEPAPPISRLDDAPPPMSTGQARRYRELLSTDPKPSDFGISACCNASAARIYQQQKQLQMLTIRLDQYKEAVLKARNNGNLMEAKELLKSVVFIKRLIQAFNRGISVDLSLLPKAPQGNQGDVSPGGAEQLPSVQIEKKPLVLTNHEDIYNNLVKDLITQVQICDLNIEFAKRTGDTSQCKFYENLRLTCKGDLIYVKRAQKLQDPPPKFRYESWTFPSLKSFPHISATEMEVHVCRALDIQLPPGYESKHADLYVSLEFPFPRDRPQVGKTPSVKGSTSPVFDHVQKFVIKPASRVMVLMMKRHGVKFEVYQKGSLFRSAKLIGSAELRLLELEDECEIEDTLTLMADKKVVSGKLVVKALIREPLVNKSADISRNWLVIDQGEIPN